MNDDHRISELDLSRAGIISVQKVMPGDSKTWDVEYQIGPVAYRIVGQALYGRPHGLDSDILMALQTMFFRAGCPEHNHIEVVPSALLSLANIAINGQAMTRLREALLRLSGVKWSMVRSSWDEKKQRHLGSTTVTGLIADLHLVDQAAGRSRPFLEREMHESLPVRITFHAPFAASIRAGLFQILDAELLSQLGQPTARSLYRVLQAHRVGADGAMAAELSLKTSDWLLACGIESERFDMARRTLDFAHDRLFQEGYLLGAEFSGRGRSGTVRYIFAQAADPEQIKLLMLKGVSRPVAEALATDHGARIVPAIRAVEERLNSGWKPRSVAGTVVDAVRNPDKWGYGAVTRKALRTPRKVSAKKVMDSDERENERDPTAALVSLLRVKLKRPASPLALEALTQLCSEGVAVLHTALTRPAAEALVLAAAILNTPL